MLTIVLLTTALAQMPSNLTAQAPLSPAAQTATKIFDFAPKLDQAAALPDMAMEIAQKARDIAPLESSLRSEFLVLGPLRGSSDAGPWVVRAGYQQIEQLNLLRARAAPWRVYPDAKILIIEVNNLFEYDQLIRDGFIVQKMLP